MIILGIDPGTTRIGYGIIERDRNKISSLAYGVISHLGLSKQDLISQVIKDLSSLISSFKPSLASIESLFFYKNQKTIISVSEMRGVILSVLCQNNIPFKEFTPLQIKQAVSSYGRADKNQVHSMVKLILGLKNDIKPDDAADGLAIAICCANTIIEG